MEKDGNGSIVWERGRDPSSNPDLPVFPSTPHDHSKLEYSKGIIRRLERDVLREKSAEEEN